VFIFISTYDSEESKHNDKIEIVKDN